VADPQASAQDSLQIRALEGYEELRACTQLQEEIWGAGFDERVPTAILRIALGYGGVLAGAFEGKTLVGFVFGLTGLEEGRLVHWSDMLAVRALWRGRGIGVALKAWQRDHLLALGVREMRWSFDPLESANARLNLVRLGAQGRWYEENMYGESNSPLHAGIGTDRLIVQWKMEPDSATTPGPNLRSALLSEACVRVPIPRSLQRLKGEDPDRARDWRLESREALAPRLREGWVVYGVEDSRPGADPALLLAPPGLPIP
jgi:predicted GNAT superfamily acetyltransferase